MNTPVPQPVSSKDDECVSVSYNGRLLYPLHSPRAAMERRVLSFPVKPGTLVFLPSPLLFYGIDVLLQRLPESSHILCVEADQALMQFSLAHTPPSAYSDPRLTYVRADSTESILATIDSVGIHSFRRACLLSLGGGYALKRTIYRRLFMAVEQEIRRFWQNKMTMIHMGHLWIKNIFQNLTDISESESPSAQRIPTINDLSVSKPVFVLGAGESLEDSLEVLHEVAGRVVILAVDTCLPVLKAADIVPDMVIALESQHANIADFYDWKNSKIPLLADLTSYPAGGRVLGGDVYYFLSEFSRHILLLERLYDPPLRLPRFPPLGSVGIAAVKIGLQITDGPVFLTGLDFSYRLGKTHACETPAWRLNMAGSNRLHPPGMYSACISRPFVRTKAKNGTECITNQILQSYRETLSHFADGPGGSRLFDAGSSGLPLQMKRIDETELLRIVTANRSTGSTNRTCRETERPSRPDESLASREKRSQPSIYAFLAAEHARLQKAEEIGFEYIARDRSTKTRESLLAALEPVNYIWAHFPEANPSPVSELGFVKRAVHAAQNYRRYLGQIMDRMKPGSIAI